MEKNNEKNENDNEIKISLWTFVILIMFICALITLGIVILSRLAKM